MSASATRPWTKYIKRANMQGGGRGNKGKPLFRGEAAYVLRLRRLELVVMNLTMRIALPQKVLDRLLQDMVELKDVDAPVGSGSKDSGGVLSLPHSGPVDGQVEGEADADGRIRAELEAWLEATPETPSEET